jgi:hypothetical protein
LRVTEEGVTPNGIIKKTTMSLTKSSAALAAALLFFALASINTQAANLIQNPDFNADTGTTGWSGSPIDITFTLDSTTGDPDAPSGNIVTTALSGDVVSNCMAIGTSQNVDFSVNLRINDDPGVHGAGARLVSFTGNDCTGDSTTAASLLTFSNAWTSLSKTNFALPAGTQSALVHIESGTITNINFDHVLFGPTGTVSPPTIALGGYVSGAWYHPGQAGHGFDLELTTAPGSTATTKTMVAFWYVYTPDGSAQNWIYAQGDYDPTLNSVTLPATLYTGGWFPPNFNQADVTSLPFPPGWGVLTFTFNDCNNGTVSWHSNLPDYNLDNDAALTITRLTQIDGTTCPQ